MKQGRKYEKMYNPIVNKLEEKGMTYNDLAIATGIKKPSIVKYINQFDSLPIERIANVENLKKMCKILGLKLKDYI